MIVVDNAEWFYWDPVMQDWKYLKPPDEYIKVTGVDSEGNQVVVYIPTDHEGSWLGGANG